MTMSIFTNHQRSGCRGLIVSSSEDSIGKVIFFMYIDYILYLAKAKFSSRIFGYLFLFLIFYAITKNHPKYMELFALTEWYTCYLSTTILSPCKCFSVSTIFFRSMNLSKYLSLRGCIYFILIFWDYCCLDIYHLPKGAIYIRIYQNYI